MFRDRKSLEFFVIRRGGRVRCTWRKYVIDLVLLGGTVDRDGVIVAMRKREPHIVR